jgi:hypothetical protein
MAVYSGPEIANNGLVFHYDMSNTTKSWKGAPTTNLLYDSGVINWTIGNLVAAVTRTTVVENSVYRITSTTGGAFRFAVPLSKLTNGLSYNLSYKYKIIVGGPSFSMTDWNDGSLFNIVNTQVDNYFFSSAYGTRSTYDNTYRFMDFTISANTVVEIWDVQLEQNTFATPFVNGTRSNTQAILDLAKTTTITANSLTYQSDGTFKLNGTSDVFSTSPSITLTSSYAIEAWIKRNVINAQHGIMSDLQYSWWLFYVNSGNKLVLRHARSAPSYVINSTVSTANIGTGWTHVAGVFDTTTGMKLYINGALDTSNTNTAVFDLGAGRGPQFIGVMREGAAGVNSSYFGGTIGAIKIYNRALTATEVQQNFEASRGRFGI